MSFKAQKLLGRLKLIQENVHKLLLSRSCDEICRAEKQTSSEVLYLLKIIRFFNSGVQDSQFVIRQCMRKLALIIKSSSYESYSQKFPFFWFLLSKYGVEEMQQFDEDDELQGWNLKDLTEGKSFHYYQQDSLPMSIEQLTYIKQQNCNQFFQEVNTNQLIMQNHQCVGCTQIFTKKFTIFNSNSAYPLVLKLSGSKAFEKGILEKYISTLCNSGGGIIIIGAETRKHQIQAIGVKFKDQSSIDLKHNYIIETIESVTPACEYHIDRVIVHTNYCTSSHVGREYMRICFRVRIIPRIKTKLHYYEGKGKCGQSPYQFYQQQNMRPSRVYTEDIYKKIHQHFKKQTISKIHSSHPNIKCEKPYPYYSKIFNDHFNQGLIEENEYFKSDTSKEETDNGLDEPSLKFVNNSLLISATQNQQKYLRIFVHFLEENDDLKDRIFIEKLYGESFRQTQRSVWIISHDIEFSELKSLYNNFLKKTLIKSDTLILMPAYHNLEVLSSKLTSHLEDLINKKLASKFSEYPEEKQLRVKKTDVFDSKKQKKICYLKFATMKLSLYVYMILENNQVRPYFVSNQEYQSKCL